MAVGWAEQGRVKVERGAKRADLEAVLRSEQVGLTPEAAGVHQREPGSEASRARGGNGVNNRGPPEPTVGRWRRRGRQQSRVKVERERSERTLRRFGGANRWSRRTVEVGRDRQGGAWE